MFREMMSSNVGEEDPQNLANAALELAEKRQKPSEKEQNASYRLLASAASFRAKVKDAQKWEFEALKMEDYVFKYSKWDIELRRNRNNTGTMAYRSSLSRPSSFYVRYVVSSLFRASFLVTS
jgi:hypothetical protein